MRDAERVHHACYVGYPFTVACEKVMCLRPKRPVATPWVPEEPGRRRCWRFHDTTNGNCMTLILLQYMLAGRDGHEKRSPGVIKQCTHDLKRWKTLLQSQLRGMPSQSVPGDGNMAFRPPLSTSVGGRAPAGVFLSPRLVSVGACAVASLLGD